MSEEPDPALSPDRVTTFLMANTCPNCEAPEVLADGARTQCVCQVCAAKFRRLSITLWAPELPVPPKPAQELKPWFHQVLAWYGRSAAGNIWVGFLSAGKWMNYWRAGRSAWSTFLAHRCKELRDEPRWMEEIGERWPLGLVKGYLVGDGGPAAREPVRAPMEQIPRQGEQFNSISEE